MTALLDRLAYYEQILNSAGEGICQIDADGRTRFVNPAAARLLGWEPHELIDRPVHEVSHGLMGSPEVPGCRHGRLRRQARLD